MATTDTFAVAVGRAIFKVVEPYYKEGKARVKGEAKPRRKKTPSGEKPMPVNAASFLVIPEAVEHVSNGGTLPYSARRLFYRVRDKIGEHTTEVFNSKSGYDYFRDTILQDYQREHGKLEGLYYDPRGRFYEPHGGKDMEVGTQSVEAYDFPAYAFNKILYVEKRGQYPLLKAARIMERYDMAILAGEGLASEAARRLIEQAHKDEEMQIFVLHDADPSGYKIARTLREETERMPGYSVEVIDLGLTVRQGIDKGLTPEVYDRTGSLDKKLINALTEDLDFDTLDFFTGEEDGQTEKGAPKYRANRFELDTMSSGEVIEHIETQLQAEGVYGKVIPPDDALRELADNIFVGEHGGWVQAAAHELIHLAKIKQELAERFKEEFGLDGARTYIEDAFEEDDGQSWREALKVKLAEIQNDKHSHALKEAVAEKVRESFANEDEAKPEKEAE